MGDQAEVRTEREIAKRVCEAILKVVHKEEARAKKAKIDVRLLYNGLLTGQLYAAAMNAVFLAYTYLKKVDNLNDAVDQARILRIHNSFVGALVEIIGVELGKMDGKDFDLPSGRRGTA